MSAICLSSVGSIALALSCPSLGTRNHVATASTAPSTATASSAAATMPRYLPSSTSHRETGLLISVSIVRSSISS